MPTTKRHRARLLVGGLLALAVVAGCGSEGDARRPNVVVFVMDTVRPDLLSVYGHERPTTPFLESFAAEGVRFDRAYSTSSWTLPSHGSLFTGVLPKTHRAHQSELHVADSLPLIQERLAEVGYQTAGFSNNVWISDRSGLNRGFDHFENYIDDYPKKLRAFAADPQGRHIPVEQHQTVRRVRRWLQEDRDDDRPFFVFVNVVEPHLPYLPPWKYASEFMGDLGERNQAIRAFYPQGVGRPILERHYGRKNPLTEEEWARLTALYEAQLLNVDDVARGVIACVDAVSDPRETIVVILSDHGENLGDHGHLTHILNVYDTNLRIPMIVRGPGFESGAVDTRPVQIHDLFTTVIRAAGLVEGDYVRGLDLRGEIDPDRVMLASLEFPKVSLGIFNQQIHRSGVLKPYSKELLVAIGPRYKLISGSDQKEEIYDLLEDPGETKPLQPTDVDQAELERLRRSLTEGIGRPAPTGEGGGKEWQTEEGLEKIKDMGYG